MGAVFFQFYVGDVSAAGVDVQFYFIVFQRNFFFSEAVLGEDVFQRGGDRFVMTSRIKSGFFLFGCLLYPQGFHPGDGVAEAYFPFLFFCGLAQIGKAYHD